MEKQIEDLTKRVSVLESQILLSGKSKKKEKSELTPKQKEIADKRKEDYALWSKKVKEKYPDIQHKEMFGKISELKRLEGVK